MIDYETYCRIRDHHQQQGLNVSQIALAMEGAFAFQAFSCEYIVNVLESRGHTAWMQTLVCGPVNRQTARARSHWRARIVA